VISFIEGIPHFGSFQAFFEQAATGSPILQNLPRPRRGEEEEKKMSDRAKTLWLPGLVSLAGSMVWRLILQRNIQPAQPLLNHAGLTLMYQLLWLAGLPLFGAASAGLSRRAGGDRSTALAAALFPSIVMVPFWMAFAVSMSHPSPRQFFGLFCGVTNWIVTPGMALALGALPFFQSQSTKERQKRKRNGQEKMTTPTLNGRTRTFWFPALVSLTAAMVCLMIFTLAGLNPRFVARGWSTFVIYIPWLLMLPLCGGAGAYLSRRAGGERRVCLIAALFPVIATTSLVGFLTLIGQFVYAKPQWLYFPVAVLLGSILPSVALLSGALPFMRAAKLKES
jgi:hypothetical protein